MKFEYEVITKCNIEVGQKLYGIIDGNSEIDYGVYEIIVGAIDFNKEKIIFVIDEKSKICYCNFDDIKKFVFEKEEEAKDMFYKGKLIGMGIRIL